MANDVINTRRVTMNDPNPINTQSRRPQGRRATPPAQPRPVSRNRNLQVPRVPNILSNLSPFRRTKSTRKTRGIKGYEVTQSQGKKRKTKVNVAKKSKRASQKKCGRKMSKRQRGGGGVEKEISGSNYINFNGLKVKELLQFLTDLTHNHVYRGLTDPTSSVLKNPNIIKKLFTGEHKFNNGEEPPLNCEYLQRKMQKVAYNRGLDDSDRRKEIIKYVKRLIKGKHEEYKDADKKPIPINCDTKEHGT